MSKELNLKSIGLKIREERESLGYARNYLAELIGVSNYYMGEIERGNKRTSIETIVNIADCLHLSLDYLILDDNSKKIENRSLYDLLLSCSIEELKIIEDVVKVILPNLKK